MQRFLVFFLFFSFCFANNTGRLALVIDDVGYSYKHCQELLNINKPLNFAVIPGLPYSKKCSQLISAKKQELIIHLPWTDQTQGYNIYLTSTMTKQEIGQMLSRAFASVPRAKGLNNHMGSQLSSNPNIMKKFMAIYGKFKNSKYFLDSMTSGKSCAAKTARAAGIKAIRNNVFLDGQQTSAYLDQQFKLAVRIARQKGLAIAICHANRSLTRNSLKKLMNKYVKYVKYVHLSEII